MSKKVYISFLFVALLSEGLGLPRGRELTFLLILLSPLILSLGMQAKQLTIPRKLVFSLLLFFVFSLYAVLLKNFLPPQWNSLIPIQGYQFVYSSFGSHNNLANFLPLPLTLSLYFYLENRRKKTSSSILSASRSSREI